MVCQCQLLERRRYLSTGAVNTLYQLPCVLSTPHCFCKTARTPARCTTQCTSSYNQYFHLWCNNKNNATVTDCIATPFTAAQLSNGMALSAFPPVLLLAGWCHALSSSASTIQIGEHAVGSVSSNSCRVYRHSCWILIPRHTSIQGRFQRRTARQPYSGR